MPERPVRLALTIGDPGGVGPELAAAILGDDREDVVFCVIGSAAALDRALPGNSRGRLPVVTAEEWAADFAAPGRPAVVDTAGLLDPPPGRPSREGGLVAGHAIEAAVRLAESGAVEGIVTGPISKEGLSLAGYPWRGHTDMLAGLLDAPDCQMVMVAGPLRIVILTRDIPLADVPALITPGLIATGVRVTAAALTGLWGIEEPRIAVSALNPHAGDGGLNGREEIDVIAPALEALVAEGFRVGGPIPADTLFFRWEEKGWDACIALYHDQGMIPFKMGGFSDGVNMTIGLPTVRTSVCHGTAYDIAGRGEADAGSMRSAVDLAVECCRVRRRRGDAA